MDRPGSRAAVYILTPGALQGAPGVVVWRTPTHVGVTLSMDRAPYSAGEEFPFRRDEVCERLDAGDTVFFDMGFLQRTKADPREYARMGIVEGRREGTLVAVAWSDGLGPQTVPTHHLRRVK